MTQVTRRELSEHLIETLNRLAAGGDPVLVDDIAVIISASEYRLLRELEDRLDLAAMAEAKAESEGSLPCEEARKKSRTTDTHRLTPIGPSKAQALDLHFGSPEIQ